MTYQQTKKRAKFNEKCDKLFIDLWEKHIDELRADGKNRPVHEKIAAAMISGGFDFRPIDVKYKINNIKKKYRGYNPKMGNGIYGPWQLYEKVKRIMERLPEPVMKNKVCSKLSSTPSLVSISPILLSPRPSISSESTMRYRKTETIWSTDEIRLLIAMAEERTALWNIDSPDYQDRETKKRFWLEISESTLHSATDCKIQWNTIRSDYNKERYKVISSTRNGMVYKPQYEFFEELRFLDTISNSETDGNHMLKWSEDAVLELISCWRKQECLYNDQHELYGQKSARLHALNQIAMQLCMKGFNVNIDSVRLKISNLRGLLTKDMKRMQLANDKGDIYKPTSWYSKLDFLQKFIRIPNDNHQFTMADDDELLQNSLSSLTDAEEDFKMDFVQNDDEILESVSEQNYVTKDCTINPNQWEFKICENELQEDLNNNFFKYIAAEMKQITDAELLDDLRQSIVLNIFQFKKRQRLLNKKN